MRRHVRSLQEEPTDTVADITQRAPADARAVIFARVFCVPTVVANAWVETLYLVVEVNKSNEVYR